MKQLSALTVRVLQVQNAERLLLQTLRQTTFSIATFYLSTPSATPPFGGKYLAPDFGINDSSLMSELIRLGNFSLNDAVDQVRLQTRSSHNRQRAASPKAQDSLTITLVFGMPWIAR